MSGQKGIWILIEVKTKKNPEFTVPDFLLKVLKTLFSTQQYFQYHQLFQPFLNENPE